MKMDSCSNMMAALLDEIVVKTDQFWKQKLTSEKLKKHYHNNYFVSVIKPKMSVKSYLHRLAKNLHISESSFILALIYIDRLTDMHPKILVNSYTVHRLWFTSVILAMKFNEDLWFSHEYNAIVSGVSKEELFWFEINFLKLIDFRLMVDSQTFKSYYNHLVEVTGSKAILSNCSWLDPVHSYKIYRDLIKTGKEIKCEGLPKHEPKIHKFDAGKFHVENSDFIGEDEHKHCHKKQHSTHTSSETTRRSSIIEKNKIMEEELEIASNVTSRKSTVSSQNDHKKVHREPISEYSDEAPAHSHGHPRAASKSSSEIDEVCNAKLKYLVEASEYPTCKHRAQKQASLAFEHHRVSF